MMVRIEASVSKGWLHKNGGFNFDRKYYTDPVYRQMQDTKINQFVRERFPHYPIYNMEANLPQAKYVKENHVLVGAIQPNLILAMILGAEFSSFADKDADVLGKPLEFFSGKNQLSLLETILFHPLVKELEKQINEISEKHPDLRIIPPFFWDESGRATIHGIITTSLKLVGDNIMILMMSNPELVHELHHWITDAYLILIRHFAGIAGITITSAHIGECSGTMISPDLYEEFVIPYIDQLGDHLGAVRLHSCGLSDHLFEAMSHVRNLNIIDTGSGSSLALIRKWMGDNFEINVAPPMELLMKGISKQAILAWLEKTLSENGDGPLQIAYHLESDYDLDNCLTIHDELERRRLIIPGRIY